MIRLLLLLLLRSVSALDSTKTVELDYCSEFEVLHTNPPCCESTCDYECCRSVCPQMLVYEPTCVCIEGYVRYNGECIPKSECPSQPSTPSPCNTTPRPPCVTSTPKAPCNTTTPAPCVATTKPPCATTKPPSSNSYLYYILTTPRQYGYTPPPSATCAPPTPPPPYQGLRAYNYQTAPPKQPPCVTTTPPTKPPCTTTPQPPCTTTPKPPCTTPPPCPTTKPPCPTTKPPCPTTKPPCPTTKPPCPTTTKPPSTKPPASCAACEELVFMQPCCEPTCDYDCSDSACPVLLLERPTCACRPGTVRYQGHCIEPSACPKSTSRYRLYVPLGAQCLRCGK